MTTEGTTSSAKSTASPDDAEQRRKKPARRGDINKCPVCAVAIDPEAYHCAKCRNYFCYHCRARLLGSDTQVHCLNRDCDYYGKLICSGCDSPHDKEEPPSVYAEPVDGYWPLWLLISLVAGVVTWFYSSFAVGALVAAGLYVAVGYGLQRAGLNIFGAERRVSQQRSSSFRTCICCQQTVKEVAPGR